MKRDVVSVDGLKELDKALGKLSAAVGKGVLRRVGKRALKPVVDLAKDLVTEDQGDLRDSLIVSTRLSKNQSKLHRRTTRGDKATVEVFAGAGPLKQAHLVEYGTGERVNQNTGASYGRMAPQPFMRPAWDALDRSVLKYISRELGDEIEKTAKRAALRAAKRK